MVLEGLLTAVGGFTDRRRTASMEVLRDGVWKKNNKISWLPMPRDSLTCAVLPLAGLEEHEEGDELALSHNTA